MAKDIETKKRKASVPADEVAKVKKAKKVAVGVAEPAKKRKAIDDAAPVEVKKSKTPKPSLDEASKPKPAKNATISKKAAVSTTPIDDVIVKEPKKSKDSAAKKLKVKDAAGSEETKSSMAKSKKATDVTYSSEDDEAEEKEDAEAVEDDAGALSEDDDQTEAFLKGFESDEDEVAEATKPIVDVGEIPSLNKKLKKQAKKAAEAAADEKPGVIYIGRIPHGFYENEMRAYFKQFGNILSLRLARNRKTGNSRHIAWIKFESSTVADIVAKTMDNYLLFGHVLKVKTIPDAQVPENLFKGANKRFKKVPWNKIAGRKLEQGASETTWHKRIEKEEERRKAKADKLQEIGYEFDSPNIKAAKNVAKKSDKLFVVAANGDADEAEEVKAIEAPPTTEESSKSKKKKTKKAKEPEPEIVDPAPVPEPKEDVPVIEEVIETTVITPEKKLKKKKFKTTLIAKSAAPIAEAPEAPVVEAAVETTAVVPEKKLKKKNSKNALADKLSDAPAKEVSGEAKKPTKSKKDKKKEAA